MLMSEVTGLNISPDFECPVTERFIERAVEAACKGEGRGVKKGARVIWNLPPVREKRVIPKRPRGVFAQVSWDREYGYDHARDGVVAEAKIVLESGLVVGEFKIYRPCY